MLYYCINNIAGGGTKEPLHLLNNKLIQEAEKPERYFVPQHILFISRGNETVGNTCYLLSVLRTPTDLDGILLRKVAVDAVGR